MKKIAIGCLAIVLALATSAFTRPHHPKNKNLVYYFSIQGVDPWVTPVTTNWEPQTGNFFHCGGEYYPCSAGYPGYSYTPGVGYSATGSMIPGTEVYQDN